MVRRTAGSGPWAGNQFWGCSRFSSNGCRGKRDINPADTSGQTAPAAQARNASVSATRAAPTSAPANDHDPSLRWAIPREVVARAFTQGNQVAFFQSNQQAACIVDAAYSEQIDRSLLALGSQWRLEFPPPKPGSQPTSEERTLLSIIEKLATRGTFSYATPALEEFILDRTGLREVPQGSLEPAVRAAAVNLTYPHRPGSFDSDEERQFSGWFLEQGSQWSILEQVDFASLQLSGAPEVRDANRVDFLLVSPDDKAVAVEIDGQQHTASVEADQARDNALAQVGIPVIRIPAAEVREGGERLRKRVGERGLARSGQADSALLLAIRLGKLAHQAQVAMVQALLGGWLPINGPWRIGLEFPSAAAIDPDLAADALETAARDCAELLHRVCNLYGSGNGLPTVTTGHSRNIPEPNIVIRFSGAEGQGAIAPAFSIADVRFPGTIAAPRTNAQPRDADSPNREDMQYFLQYLFRKEDFREGQWETIDRMLQGCDSIVLLPTGGGKSIAFQLSALLRPGCCVVVDPIISLIEDQIDNLHKVGIDRCLEISSQVASEVRRESVQNMANYLFVYMAPERFQSQEFRDALRSLTVSVPISEVAIDEAHCVSEWGHDFRTSYLRLGDNARDYCTSQGRVPPVVALTGTASRMVLKNIQLDLGIHEFDAVITPKTFNRQELEFKAFQCSIAESRARLKGFLESLPGEFGFSRSGFFAAAGDNTQSVIVFTSTVSRYKGTAQTAEELRKHLRISSIETYSRRAPRGIQKDKWNDIKKTNARRFKYNEIPMLVATNAYGMGIDKPNVRSTVHFGLPPSIEAFYQEAGRAGRDQSRALCGIVFTANIDSHTLLDAATPIEVTAAALKNVPLEEQDDVLQALWFHNQSFKGVAEEQRRLTETVRALGQMGLERSVTLTWDGDTAAAGIEKSLYRLSVVGAVKDYTKAGVNAGTFTVQLAKVDHQHIIENLTEYISNYQALLANNVRNDLSKQIHQPIQDFAISAGSKLIEFVYDHVEKSRRRALFEMLQAAQAAAGSPTEGNQVLRERVLRHLEWSEFDDVLQVVVDSKQGGLDAVAGVLDLADTLTAAGTLRGAVGRLLESYPDQPGLLIIRGVAEALAGDSKQDTLRQDIQAALTYATSTYRIDREVIADALGESIRAASSKGQTGKAIVAAIAEHESFDREFARLLMERVPQDLAYPLVAWLTRQLTKSSQEIRKVYHDKQQQ